MAGQEPVDERQRRAHAARERLVLGVALERIDPDDRVRLPGEPGHLTADELGVLALPAVRDDDHDGAARQRTAAVDVVELLERRADAGAAAPVRHLAGGALERGLGVARLAGRPSAARAACRRRTPPRHAPLLRPRAGKAAARGCTPPSSLRRRRARRACAAPRCGRGRDARAARRRCAANAGRGAEVQPLAARSRRSRRERRSGRVWATAAISRRARANSSDVIAAKSLSRSNSWTDAPTSSGSPPASCSSSSTRLAVSVVRAYCCRRGGGSAAPGRLDRRAQEPGGERAVEELELVVTGDERLAQRPVHVALVGQVDRVEPGERVLEPAGADLHAGLAQHAAERDDVAQERVSRHNRPKGRGLWRCTPTSP